MFLDQEQRKCGTAIGPRCSASSYGVTELRGGCYRVPSTGTLGRGPRAASGVVMWQGRRVAGAPQCAGSRVGDGVLQRVITGALSRSPAADAATAAWSELVAHADAGSQFTSQPLWRRLWRVQDGVPRCPAERPRRGWRASMRARAVQDGFAGEFEHRPGKSEWTVSVGSVVTL
jgi:hypothetical protein